MLLPYLVLRQSFAAKLGPRGPDVAAIFGLRTEFCCQIWSHSAIFGPTAWDKIWQQNSVLGPNMAAILLPRTKYGCNILS